MGASAASSRGRGALAGVRTDERRDRLFDVVGADVEVRDGAEHVRRRRERQQDALGPEPLQEIGRIHARRVGVELDEVRLDPLRVHRESRVGERLAEPPGIGVIVREPLDVVVEPVDARGGDDAGLAHRAAEHVLEPPRLARAVARGRDERAEGTAEPLREAQRDRVGLASPLRRRQAGGHGGVHEPGAVEMDGEPVRPRLGDDGPVLVERPDATARAVVRVLDREHPRRRRVQIAGRVDRGANLLRGEPARGARKRLHHEPGMNRRPPQLVQEDVGIVSADQLVTRLGEQAQRDLVSHRRAREVDGFLLAEQLRGPLLERRNRRILALLLVADDGLGHRFAHPRGRLRERVGAQIDHAFRLVVFWKFPCTPRRRLPFWAL